MPDGPAWHGLPADAVAVVSTTAAALQVQPRRCGSASCCASKVPARFRMYFCSKRYHRWLGTSADRLRPAAH